MIGVVMPEIVIYNAVEALLNILRDDLKEKTRDEDTILFSILGINEEGKKIQMNLYNYYKQAKKILTTTEGVNVSFGFNQEVAKMVAIHIILPSEQGTTAIGGDEGYMVEKDEGGTQFYYTQTFDATYQIMITSTNSSEVNLIYNVLKSMFLMVLPNIDLMGLRNPSFSGNDIMMKDEFTPVPIYSKVLNLSFHYELNVPQLTVQRVIKKFHFALNPDRF